MTDDERAIRDLVETWMTATRAGDIHTVLDLMTDDVVFMTPANPPFGKEAFKEAAGDMNRLDNRWPALRLGRHGEHGQER